MRAPLCIITLVALLAVVAPARAATIKEEGKRPSLRPNRLGAWMGVSFDSPAGVYWGQTEGRDFHEVGFQFAWRLLDREHFRIDYTLDLIPFAMVTGNPRYRVASASLNGVRPRWIIGYETKYGVGVNPIGLMVGVPVSKALCVFGSGGFGILAFESAVPTPNASIVNVTFGFGAGLELAVTERWSAVFGYKLHHLSNAGRGYDNPGIDSHIYYMGARWLH